MSDNNKDLYLEAIQDLSSVVKETNKQIADLDKKLDLHIQKTSYELERINDMDRQQNKLLDQHIEGVNTLKKWCDIHERNNDSRFQKLEEPKKWLNTTKNIVLWLSAVAGALTVLAHFLKMF